MKKPDRTRVLFLMPTELRDKFTKLCKARDYPRNDIVEKLVTAYVNDADENGWTEYVDTQCSSCQNMFKQERLREKPWCSPECHLVYATFEKKINKKRKLRCKEHGY